ncbi:MAG TPA: recombination factor protein RarA, partial [Limnobacter sp.]|nr:recombination factor protein RarA [Limnobacter sp.]
MDLFGDAPPSERKQANPLGSPAAEDAVPLAERLRPQTLGEVVGQRHLVGSGKPLSVLFEQRKLHSLILWGPPGVGKTTLA